MSFMMRRSPVRTLPSPNWGWKIDTVAGMFFDYVR